MPKNRKRTFYFLLYIPLFIKSSLSNIKTSILIEKPVYSHFTSSASQMAYATQENKIAYSPLLSSSDTAYVKTSSLDFGSLYFMSLFPGSQTKFIAVDFIGTIRELEINPLNGSFELLNTLQTKPADNFYYLYDGCSVSSPPLFVFADY